MIRSLWTYILFSFLLIGCVPGEEGNVKVLTKGIFGSVEVTVVDGNDRGEFLIGSDADVVQVMVKNQSSYSLTSLILEIDEDSTAGMKFNPIDGKSLTPGRLGDCSSTLKSGESCSFMITYTPSISGEFYQNISVSYDNLVDHVIESRKLTMLAGEAASLIFTTEEVNYSFGIIERTDREQLIKKLIIKNTGGLTAYDIAYSISNNPNSGAYSILSNTCTDSLVSKETCEMEIALSPQNYGPSSTDGDVDLYYYSTITIPYTRDPDGGKSALNAYFSTKSYNINGKIVAAGVANINFDDLVVGNYTTESFRVKNDGDKEAILHYLNLKNESGDIVGSCVKVTGETFLECRDPEAIDVAGNPLSLPTMPFRIEDKSDCVTPYELLDYVRGSDGSLPSSDIVEIAGKVAEEPGSTCSFDITYHPSTSFSTSGDFNNWSIGIAFDSTWKNTIDLKGFVKEDESAFNIDSAIYFAAAKISSSSFEYGGDASYLNLDTNDNGLFSYDLGRISLISNDVFRQQVKIKLRNSGGNIGKITSLKDGQATAFNFSGSSQDINSYYLNASHSGCTTLTEGGGECDFRFQLAPLASTNPDSALAQAAENSQMYDDVTNKQKKFFIEYEDGSTYNDDLTLRSNPVIEINMSAKLIRKGYLVFEDTSSEQGVISGITPAGNIEFQHIKLKNVGTGTIPYIEAVAGKILERPNGSTSAFPYEIVDRSGGEDGADKDCYELINFDDSIQPTSSTIIGPTLDPGENCSLTVKMKLRETDRKLISSYNDDNSPEWERYYTLANNNTTDAWEYDIYSSSINEVLSFRYFDGDGTPDTLNGYTPDLENYGNKYIIGGGSNGEYNVNIEFGDPGKLIPIQPLPSSSGIVFRDMITLPAIAMDGWGNSLNPGTIAPMFRDFSENQGVVPASHSSFSNNHFISTFGMMNSFGTDFVFHAGTFNPGQVYSSSLQLSSEGDTQVTNVSVVSSTPSSEIQMTLDSNNKLNFTFLGDTNFSGFYSQDIVIQYQSGETNLDNEGNLTYSNVTKSISLTVIVEYTSAPKAISLSSQEYSVTYDSGSNTTSEVLDGDVQSFTLTDTIYTDGQVSTFKAIKGSEVYMKKKFTVTNSGSNPITRIDSVIKTTFDSPLVSNVTGGRGYSISSNNCLNTALNTGMSCDIDIVLDASTSEPDLTERYLVLTYAIESNQFVSSAIKIDFTSANPANLSVASTNPENILNSSGGIIQGSYPIDLGYYIDASHPVLNTFPTEDVTVSNVTILNSATEKASFLLQYRNHVSNPTAEIPGSAFVEIYNDNINIVSANRACFYGDDINDGISSTDDYGFNVNTTSSCKLTIVKKFDDDYVGKKLEAKDHNLKLDFYNSGRSSNDEIYLHFKGFLEPNPSTTTDTALSDVVTNDQGDISFSWSEFSPSNSAWGSVVGYEVFYSTTKLLLNNIYETNASSIETTSREVSLTGLTPGNYYYIKIVAKRRTSGGKEYLSESDQDIIELIAPPEDTFYNYELNVVVDMHLSPKGSPQYGTKSEVADGCLDEYQEVTENGVSVKKYKKLITSDIFSVINEDEDYSSYGIPGTSHWTSDPVIDISTIFGDSFNCSETGGVDSTSSLFYQKSCSDCSCNNLSRVEGGDGENLPPTAIVYADGEEYIAAQRCYFDL